MKINFLISSLSCGGAEKVLTTIAKKFANDGNDVAIISLEKKPQFYMIDEKAELIKVDNKEKHKLIESIEDYKAIRRFLKTRKADISISFLARCNLLSLLSKIRTGNKVIVCDRNNPLREHSKIIFNVSCLIYRLADGIIVQTEQIKSFYPNYLQKKISIIENPIDTEELQKQITDKNITKENIISSIGRLESQKDFETLIRAFALIANDYPDWKVKIFGNGKKRDKLQKLILDLNVGNQVLLCGITDRPFLELKKSKIFVLSSYYEGFPNVLCEAMYAGCACISSDCVSGPRELIEDGKNGFLFEVGDVETLAEKLRTLLDNEKLRDEFGERAIETTNRLRVNEIFNRWKKCVENI